MRDLGFDLSMMIRCLRQLTLCAVVLVSAAALSGQPPLQRPQDSNTDQNARNTKPIHDQKATRDVAEKLEKAFDPKNAAYAGSTIKPAVDDQTVTLTGTVKDEGQHEMALQVARAYAGNRKIVDQLKIR